ncbi:MAG: hypothetical protein ACREMH_08465 [Gemmatimonadales bacterium]
MKLLGQRYEPMTMLLFPTPDDAMAEWTEVVRRTALTGHHGDGVIMVVPLELLLRIGSPPAPSTP